MKQSTALTPEDLAQLSQLGISTTEVQRQMRLFQQPPAAARLIRPCIPGDGIVQISEHQQTRYLNGWRAMIRQQRLAKFVPASGAASRMFKDLIAPVSSPSSSQFLESLPRFAFFEALKASVESTGTVFDSLLEQEQVESILEYLLEPQGLNYKSSPKGLILFHRDEQRPRSALEEQLWEGASYLALPGGTSRFNFTVTGDHAEAFRKQTETARVEIEEQLKMSLQVEFSTQSPATDTLSLDSSGHLVRRPDGGLLLRPSGHGALLENLQSVDADVVFVKNIDNVSHQRLHPLSIHWKRVLAGRFAEIQEQVFDLLDALESEPESREPVDRALELLKSSLAVGLPEEMAGDTHQVRHRYAVSRLDRPLRVCGMVKNEGEPGGGPFWLPDNSGGVAGQIVEAAQTDLTAADQAEIWQSSSHFNPVDLVCGLRNRHGHPYHLADFVDPATSFVARKTHAGRPLQALERPGLWNGGMAHWNTAFVEVPLLTFTPVKTVFDLLRPEHQP